MTGDADPGLRGLQQGDVITAVDFWAVNEETGVAGPSGKPMRLWPQQWAYVVWCFAEPATEVKQLTLQFERQGRTFEITLAAGEDPTWPMVERGLIYAPESYLDRAGDPIESLGLGARRAANFWARAAGLGGASLSGEVKPEAIGGPVMVVAKVDPEQRREMLIFFALRLWIGANMFLFLVNVLPLPGSDAWSLGRLWLSKYQASGTVPADRTGTASEQRRGQLVTRLTH